MKVSKTDATFLAATVTAASLATIAVVPKVADKIKQDTAQVQAELQRNKRVDPKDAFGAGVAVGAIAGAAGTAKIIADKLNAP